MHVSPMKTTSFPSASPPAVCAANHGLFRTVSLLASIGALAFTGFAQAPAAPDAEGRARRRDRGTDANANGNTNGGRGTFDPAAMQERLRELFGVTDDAEWALISERITKVNELRRGALGGAMMARGGPGGPPAGGASGRGNRPTGNPEVDSLRSAIADKLPDAEIKSRLARLRDSRKENEAKLTKAQEDLRAVLSLRQEAIAVMSGLLP